MSYSQQNEEEHILKHVPGFGEVARPNGEPYRFLDIGAWHPTQFSNTRALFEMGWGGVMIEPSPGPMLNLLKEYGQVPRITLICGAVTCEPGLVELHITDDAVSTMHQETFEKWDGTAKFHGKMTVPGIPLEYLASRFGGFEFVNIDAEGISVDLFIKMMNLGWQPKVICCETDNRLEEMCAIATPLHYKLVDFNGTNAVLVRG